MPASERVESATVTPEAGVQAAAEHYRSFEVPVLDEAPTYFGQKVVFTGPAALPTAQAPVPVALSPSPNAPKGMPFPKGAVLPSCGSNEETIAPQARLDARQAERSAETVAGARASQYLR